MDPNHPLGLPRGSVRALLAIFIVMAALVYFLLYQDLPQALAGVLGVVIGYYFGSRTANGQGG